MIIGFSEPSFCFTNSSHPRYHPVGTSRSSGQSNGGVRPHQRSYRYPGYPNRPAKSQAQVLRTGGSAPCFRAYQSARRGHRMSEKSRIEAAPRAPVFTGGRHHNRQYGGISPCHRIAERVFFGKFFPQHTQGNYVGGIPIDFPMHPYGHAPRANGRKTPGNRGFFTIPPSLYDRLNEPEFPDPGQ